MWNAKEKQILIFVLSLRVTIYNLHYTYIIFYTLRSFWGTPVPEEGIQIIRQTEGEKKKRKKEKGRLVVGTRSSRPSKLDPRWTNGPSFPVRSNNSSVTWEIVATVSLRVKRPDLLLPRLIPRIRSFPRDSKACRKRKKRKKRKKRREKHVRTWNNVNRVVRKTKTSRALKFPFRVFSSRQTCWKWKTSSPSRVRGTSSRKREWSSDSWQRETYLRIKIWHFLRRHWQETFRWTFSNARIIARSRFLSGRP